MCTTKTTKGRKDPTYDILGCAFAVHRELGPGLLESSYEQCLAHELSIQGFNFEIQVTLPLKFKGVRLDCGYRIDILVEDCVILELKAVDQLLRIHEAQVLTYMKLSGISLGLLINFNSAPLKKGIRRFRI